MAGSSASAASASLSQHGWSPFLSVLLGTIFLFALFAAITFALMKYVKFVNPGLFQESSHRSRSSANSLQCHSMSACSSSASGSQAGATKLIGLDQRNTPPANMSGSLHRARLINLETTSNSNSINNNNAVTEITTPADGK